MTIYDNRIASLRQKKLEQTAEKIRQEGLLDEDDYGRIVPPDGLWEITSNHPDGSFYGFDAWADNFCSLMDVHPTYIDPDDAFAGRWMYFMSKMRPNKWNPAYGYDHLKPEIEKYDIICGIGDDAHFAPDYALGLQLGWCGILDRIEQGRKQNPGRDRFYDIHKRAVEAIQGWIKRHIEKAREMACMETCPVRKANLRDIAEVNTNILSAAPCTLREACQWMIWYHLASRTYNRDGAGGQIDALLRPYFERDIAEGKLDEDTAVWYLACFLINDPVYWQLGGPDEDGNDQTSRISFLILEAAGKLNTSLNITVRVHDGLDKELFDKAVECLIKYRNGWPRFSGDRALVEGFVKNGFDKRLARRRIAVGCNWMSLPGLEYTMNDLVKVNMARVWEVAFDEMMTSCDAPSTGNLWWYFSAHLKKAVNTAAHGIRHHLEYQKYNEPELILNLLSHGPLEKGLDASDGGAEFYNLAIDGAGLAVVADSFAALEQRIEIEGKLGWVQVRECLLNDFETTDGGYVRTLLRNSGRYGMAGSGGEKWALKVKDLFTAFVREESEPGKRRVFIPGFFSWASTVGLGSAVGATPDGRKAGTPISHGANPSPGFAVDDASISLAVAVAAVQPGYGNTAPMQWELDPSLAREDNRELIGAIIKSHFALGGTLINANIMDKQKVIEAHKDPAKYPDLVVRVTGFTAYFSMLSPGFRQLVVDRLLES